MLEGLRALSSAGVALHVLHGNRDFLLGSGFAAATGACLLPEPTLVDLDGTPTLLLHGDSLCTDDIPYQQLRRTLRDPAWVAGFLARPAAERIALARSLRAQSRAAVDRKDYASMDVNAEAVATALRTHGARRMVHGHTHRAGEHHWELDGLAVTRLVLGDWAEEGGSVLVCAGGEWRLEGV